MLNKILKLTGVVAMCAMAGMSFASAWTLDGENSKLAYGSIKKDKIGEVNSFGNLKGSVSPDGKVNVEIDLSSVQTNIDIRNERMIEHVFKKAPAAQLTADIDMADIEKLKVGENSVVDVEGNISFLSVNIPIEAEMFVARLSEKQVMVTTNDMIFVATEDLGIDAGIDILMGLADLPGITRTSPVILRLIFTNEDKRVDAAPAAQATQVALATGDVKAGKNVYKRCKACHTLVEGKHTVGPSLKGIVNTKAGAIEGYKYSKAMLNSGLTWDVETLSAFLAKPRKVVKGSKMAFSGLRKPADIENVIAYIQSK